MLFWQQIHWCITVSLGEAIEVRSEFRAFAKFHHTLVTLPIGWLLSKWPASSLNQTTTNNTASPHTACLLLSFHLRTKVVYFSSEETIVVVISHSGTTHTMLVSLVAQQLRSSIEGFSHISSHKQTSLTDLCPIIWWLGIPSIALWMARIPPAWPQSVPLTGPLILTQLVIIRHPPPSDC